MRRQLFLAKIIVTNQQTKMHKLTVITEPTTRKTSKLLNERRLNNYIWMNQLNKANAKRSTSLKNLKDWLPGRSVYESAASVPWNSRIMGVHENLWSVTESHTSWHCSLLCRKKHFRCQVCVRPLTCSQWRKPVHSRSPADRLFLNFAKRSVASASTNTVESLTDTLPVVRGKLALLARLKQQPATQERWSTHWQQPWAGSRRNPLFIILWLWCNDQSSVQRFCWLSAGFPTQNVAATSFCCGSSCQRI